MDVDARLLIGRGGSFTSTSYLVISHEEYCVFTRIAYYSIELLYTM
jgi:hypothetical protein